MRTFLACIALASMVGGLMGAPVHDHSPATAIAAAGQVPLSFERVSSGNAHWMARGNGYRLAVGPADIEVGLGVEQLRMVFVGGNAKAPSTGLDALPGKVNYFIGRDPKSWLRDVPTYGRVRYKDVYPGVDVVWYGKQGRLEYDLDIKPGANPDKIGMRFEGARKLTLQANGDLRVELAGGSLSLKLPEVYQEGSSGRRRVDGSYELRDGNEVGFRLAAYDKTMPLVIDPTLVYATYFGSYYPYVTAVAVDGSGNVYMGGYVQSDGIIPVVNPVQAGNLGYENAYIAKFDPTGQTLLYSTYLGGSQFDQLHGIAVDSTTSDVVGAGVTQSPDFPLVNPVQATIGSGSSGFAFRLNAAGNQLVYSTYLGGSGSGNAYGVALDASGNAYFTGSAGAFQTTPGAVNNCCTFVEKLSATGGEVYGAQMGADQGNAIAVDSLGAAYVAGYSTEASFPNSPPGARSANAGGLDAFVAKLSPDATSLTWATFLGGSGKDSASAIALGVGNLVYFGGQTTSSDLPVTAGVVQGTYGGGTDAFVAGLSADGSSFGFVTYLGGGKSDSLASLAVSATGLLLAGNTSSPNFPTANAIQPAFPGSPDAFFKSTDSGAAFSPADSGLSYVYGGNILPDPSSAGTILVDTGEGIFRSTNDGATWTNVEQASNGGAVRSLSNPSVVYAPGGCYLYKSTDGGQTWGATTATCTPGASVIGISATNPNTVLLFDASTEYRSTDGGVTFPQSIAIPFSSYYFPSPSPIVASPDGSLYAVAGSSGLYKSTDSGVTWSQLGHGAPANAAAFALSASNAAILYADDGTSVYKSTNSGASWSTIGPGTAVKYLAVDPTNPQTLYGTSPQSARVITSTDGGATWTPTAGVLDSYYIQGLAISPSNHTELYVSNRVTQSGFVSKLSTTGTNLVWSTFYGPHDNTQMGAAAVAPSGNAWVAGIADSGTLPLTPNARNGNTYASGAAFLAEIADATAACAYTINPATQYSYSAGQLVFSVTAPSGCAWTATPSDSWIHLIRSSGTGSGTIPLAVDANTTASTRNGTVNVNSQIYTIVQPPSSCTYQLSYPSLGSAGGTATITVTAPAGCPWDVELQNSDPAAVTSPSTGTGNGNVMVSIPPNASPDVLSYNLLIGNSPSLITEAAASSCVYSFPNGTSVTVPADALSYSIQINANQSGCLWGASSDQPGWVTLTNPNSNGSGLLNYSVALNNTGVDRKAHITIGGQSITVTQDFTSAEFADVPPSAAYFDAANLMYLAGVTTGCVTSSDPSSRMYCPNDSVTREQMAAFIVRAVTGTLTPAVYDPVPIFTDVPTTNPFFPHIQKMEELGITDGCGTGLFCPTDTVPRWQMAIFMVRARLALYGASFSYNGTPYFADVPTNVEGNTTTFPFIQRAYEEHVTNGCGTNPLIYCPDELVTRGEMASFIMRGLFNQTTILGPTAPQVTGVVPNTMAATVGTQITVTITGINTSFQTGDTVTVPSGMLDVSNVVVNSATSISATLTANSTVAAGPQTVVVTSGGQNLTLPLAIKVGTY